MMRFAFLKHLKQNDLPRAVLLVLGIVIGFAADALVAEVPALILIVITAILVPALLGLLVAHSAIRLIDQFQSSAITVKFFQESPGSGPTGKLYQTATDYVCEAKESIFVLWAYPRSHTRRSGRAATRDSISPEYLNARQQYYDKLIAQCGRWGKKTFFYRRILQIKEPNRVRNGQVPGDFLTPEMAEHCARVTTLNGYNRGVAELKYAPCLIDQTVVIIDNRYILWEIDLLEPYDSGPLMDGLLVFDDPTRLLVDYFMNVAERVRTEAKPVRKIILPPASTDEDDGPPAPTGEA